VPALIDIARAAEPGKGMMSGSLWVTFQRGGPVMWPILLLSIFGLALILEFLFTTRRAGILPPAIEQDLASAERGRAVPQTIESAGRTVIGRALAAGQRWHKGSHEQIQSAIEESISGILWKFRRSFRPLGIIANTAPLLGLLGTVFGIIEAFDVVAQQGALGDPSALADGIAEALLTTAFGLIVAIPMLLAYHYFVGKVESLLHRCEELAKEALILPPE
jgi:biopolymer transport protein ExbB